MRYDTSHKARTREAILRAAGRLFRRYGYAGVGIEAIMQEAGLTRGGFYHHFASKEALLAEVLRWDRDLIDRLRDRNDEALVQSAIEVCQAYLEPAHRDVVGAGCNLSSLTPDVIRSGNEARAALADTIRALVRELERGLPDAERDDERALAAAAICVGGLILSRGADGSRLANRISHACQTAVARELSRAKTDE